MHAKMQTIVKADLLALRVITAFTRKIECVFSFFPCDNSE